MPEDNNANAPSGNAGGVSAASPSPEVPGNIKRIEDIPGMSIIYADRLRAAGIDSLEKLAAADPAKVADLAGIDQQLAGVAVEVAKKYAPQPVAPTAAAAGPGVEILQPKPMEKPKGEQIVGKTVQEGVASEGYNAKSESTDWTAGYTSGRGNLIKAGVVIVLIAVVIIAAFLMLHPLSGPGSNRTSNTPVSNTIVFHPVLRPISSCMKISLPGTYYITKNITVGLASGPCINVTSGNTSIDGMGRVLHGAGPYAETPPFTYGVYADKIRNITISNFTIDNFSYGAYLSGVTYSEINGMNMSHDTISGILMNDSSGNRILHSAVSGTASSSGGIYIEGGGNNLVYNVTSYANANIGVRINGTRDTFAGDAFVNNPTDMICSISGGLRNSNLFSASKCSTSYQCGFAECSASNIPVNVSSIHLQGSIDSCGGIYRSGNYVLRRSLSMLEYLNMSNPLSKGQPCISVLAPSVSISCNGYAISDAGYGILVNNLYTRISGCELSNDTTGIYVRNNFDIMLLNTSIRHGTYGLMMNNVTTGIISNVSASGLTYGFYINNTTGVSFEGINAENNTYGVYYSNNSGNAFNGGGIRSNSKVDLYCSIGSYTATSNLFQNVVCGSTDCNWGSSCPVKTPPPLTTYYMNQCTGITYSGNYSLSSNIIVGSGTCIGVYANNVRLSCGGHSIAGSGSAAISISGRNNVSVDNCNINGFRNGIKVAESQNIALRNDSISGGSVGIQVSNSSQVYLLNSVAAGFNSSGFVLDRVTGSYVHNNFARSSLPGTSGFVLDGLSGDNVSFNNAKFNSKYGFLFGGSFNNSVSNNTAFNNGVFDYACIGSYGIYSEEGGINNGGTKSNCPWLVALPQFQLRPVCLAINSASQISLSSDMVYPYAQTCYSVYNTASASANNTVINCNFHTVIATSGGTFVSIINSSYIKVENCYLKGFTNAITSSGGTGNSAINNTIGSSKFGITFSNASRARISGNMVQNSTYGISLVRDTYCAVDSNHISGSNTSIYITGGIGESAYENNATHDLTGIYIYNNSQSIFQNNIFDGTSAGMKCSGGASGVGSLNKDQGGNACSSNSGCTWITSPMCKA
jgi:parallel beta-helix repeat protein